MEGESCTTYLLLLLLLPPPPPPPPPLPPFDAGATLAFTLPLPKIISIAFVGNEPFLSRLMRSDGMK